MEPQQHQLLLAIKGLPNGAAATIGELAERLQLKHHSTVELVNRLEKLGYVAREGSEQDRRIAKESGFDHLLTKPADPGMLQQLLGGAA